MEQRILIWIGKYGQGRIDITYTAVGIYCTKISYKKHLQVEVQRGRRAKGGWGMGCGSPVVTNTSKVGPTVW